MAYRSVPSWTVVAARLLVIAAAVVLPRVASAGPLDLHLERFFDPTPGSTEKYENKAYTTLMREVSLAMGSRMSGPIASQGPLGIEAGYEMSLVGVHESTWAKAADDASGTLTTHAVRVRKGLPHSVSVGTSLTHLTDSNLWAIGAEIGLSFVDGFRNIPDFGVRLGVDGVMGNSNMDMVSATADVTLSKSFGVAGLLALQPWLAYSPSFTHVSTHLLPVFPTDNAIKPEIQAFKPVDVTGHRGAVGVRLVAARVQAGFELLRSFTDDLNVITLRLGAVF